jgi:hypothetical protein
VAVIEPDNAPTTYAPCELNTYEARIEAKRERFKARANKAHEQGNARYRRSRS